MFNNLGIAYRRRVHHTDTCKAGDLDQAISNLKQALELTDVDDVGRCARMANLGNCYYSRFNHSFDSDDITQAILWHENAVNSARASPPERSRALICLGMSLCRRYEHTKDPAHVQKAISAYREAATQADVDPFIRLDAAEEWALHSIHHPPDVVHHLGSMTLGKATLMQVNIEKDNSEFLMALHVLVDVCEVAGVEETLHCHHRIFHSRSYARTLPQFPYSLRGRILRLNASKKVAALCGIN